MTNDASTAFSAEPVAHGQLRPRRSVLYMPGANARALEKAKSLAADCLIFDLEDAVAPDQKADGRANITAALAGGGYGRREIIIRVNGLDTPWGADDVAAAVAAGPDAILIPKVGSGAMLDAVAKCAAPALAGGGRQPDLWAMIETPQAMLNIAEIAGWSGAHGLRLAGFVAGTNDLAKETGASLGHDRVGMLAWLSMMVAAARAHGLAPIDGVYNDFKDEAGLAAECAGTVPGYGSGAWIDRE